MGHFSVPFSPMPMGLLSFFILRFVISGLSYGAGEERTKLTP
ncbi:hypothetical protein [Prevotella corporis]|nr:hypothetical protein [Prevotella corporis]